MKRLFLGLTVIVMGLQLTLGVARPVLAAPHTPNFERALPIMSDGYELPWLVELLQQVSTWLDRLIDTVADRVSTQLPSASFEGPRAASVAPVGWSVELAEASLAEQTNAAREAAGLPPLQVDAALTALARQRSQDMIDRDFFAHTDPATGSSLVAQYCVAPLGVAYCGENLAGAVSLADAGNNVVARWLASEGHRENLLRPEFGRMGIGVAEGGPWGAVVTQLLAP
jgi:uncharacterized protein YkwD